MPIGGLVSGVADAVGGVADAVGGVADGVSDAFGGGGAGAGGGDVQGVDFGALAATFNKATQDTLEITRIKTIGDVAKDGARQRPS